MMKKKTLIRFTTSPKTLLIVLKNQLNYLNQYFDVVAVSNKEPSLNQVSKQENVRIRGLTIKRPISILHDLLSIAQMMVILKIETPFILHAQTPKAGLIGMVSGKLLNIPHRIYSIVGLPLMAKKGLKKHLLIAIEKITIALATKVFVNSKNLRDYIIEHNLCKKNKLFIIGEGSSNGIDLDYFNPALISPKHTMELKTNLSLNNAFVFTFIGRLVSDKGINELIEAFNTLSQTYTHIKLLLVGEFETQLDPLKKTTLVTIEDHPKIIYCGFKDDIRPYLSVTSVFVLPSYREGFPNVLLQAGSFNLPIIATNINGCNEIVKHKKSGLLIPKQNTDALRHAMENMIQNPNLCLQFGKNARDQIKKNYDQATYLKNLVNEYAHLT